MRFFNSMMPQNFFFHQSSINIHTGARTCKYIRFFRIFYLWMRHSVQELCSLMQFIAMYTGSHHYAQSDWVSQRRVRLLCLSLYGVKGIVSQDEYVFRRLIIISFSLLLWNYLLILKILSVNRRFLLWKGSRLWFCKIIPEAACDKLILVHFPCSLWENIDQSQRRKFLGGFQ